MEASRVEANNGANDLALRLLEARSTLILEYGSANEPCEPQLAFCRLQAKVVEKEKALRFATIDVGTFQALLDIERQGCTSSPSMERELIHL